MSRSSSPSTTHFRLLVVIALLLLSVACQAYKDGFDAATAEATLRTLDAEWSRSAGAKDIDKTVSFYSDDALVMPSNSPVLQGKAAAREMWQSMFSMPGFGGGWKATKVEVAQSGDLAYVTGTYEINETDASGKPKTDKGKYLEVWKKQTDGSWKCVADMFNTSLPAAAPATADTKSDEVK